MSIARELELERKLEERIRFNALKYYDPYPFQVDFHNDESDRVGLLASNQTGKCVSYGTLIDTPDGKRRIGDLFGSKCEVLTYPDNEPRNVLNWVRKPKEECFRITMSDGQWIECPRGHLVLTALGYVQVDHLIDAFVLRNHRAEKKAFEAGTFFHSPHLSSLGISLSAHVSGVRRYCRRLQDYLGGYLVDYRLHDGQLLSAEDSVEVFSPLRDGVRLRSLTLFYWGGLLTRCSDSLLSKLLHLSNLGVFHRFLGQIALLSSQAFSSVERRSLCGTRGIWQSNGLVSLRQEVCEVGLHRPESLLASDYPVTVDSNHIVSIKSVGYNTLYDMEVDERHNYIAAGMVNHNTRAGTVQDSFDLTGRYPQWYEGFRYDRPIHIVCGCFNNDLTRDILQDALCGDPTDKEDSFGTGWLPLDCLDRSRVSLKRGVTDAYHHVMTKHFRHAKAVKGIKRDQSRYERQDGWSKVTFSTYEAGKEAWMGSTIDVYHGDEECKMEILAQMGRGCIATQGRIRMTFTPENGETDVLMKVRDEWSMHEATFADIAGEKCEFTFDDGEILRLEPVYTLGGRLGHINNKTLENLSMDNPPWMLKTRMLGKPMIGEGLVFPYSDSQLTVEPFEFPDYFLFLDAIDFGGLSSTAHPTAFVRLAYDPQNDVVYVYDGFLVTGKEIPYIATDIRSMAGVDIPIIWPHDGNKELGQGGTTKEQYVTAGVNMFVNEEAPDKSHFTNPPEEDKKEGSGGIQIMPGITEISSRICTNKFKVFSTVDPFFVEYRSYHMKDGKIIDRKDDFMSATRYGVQSIRHFVSKITKKITFNEGSTSTGGWMGS